MALFESYERRIDQINAVLNSYGISSIEEAEKITKDAGLDVYDQVKKIQPICFENACWAYTVGAAIAIKKGCRRAADAAAAIGEGLQAFCIPGSVADHRKVGLGHGNLGKMLLEEETECFCFLAGHESFAAAEGAIGIAEKANKVRQKPLRVILNGLGKDAAQIISRINGFTFVETQYDYKAAKLNIVSEHAYSDGLRATVKCYGADDVQEGVAIMHHENVGVSITGNSTNPTRFQHPVAGTYKKECIEQGKKYFSVASGGGTGRTLHPDNMFIFGMSSDEVISHENRHDYNPVDVYNNDAELRKVVNQLVDGTYSPNDHELFRELYNSLLNPQQGQVADRYFILADFRSYANAQQKINDYYKNKSAWRKSALLNIAHVGKFSSDITIQEYVDDIWHLDRITVNMAGV